MLIEGVRFGRFSFIVINFLWWKIFFKALKVEDNEP